jgi:hypothetical protein
VSLGVFQVGVLGWWAWVRDRRCEDSFRGGRWVILGVDPGRPSPRLVGKTGQSGHGVSVSSGAAMGLFEVDADTELVSSGGDEASDVAFGAEP